MAGAGERAAAFVKGGGGKAKAAGVKVYAAAKDPEVREKAQRVIDDGKKVYRVLTSSEAQRMYRLAGEALKRTRKK